MKGAELETERKEKAACADRVQSVVGKLVL